MLVLQVRATTLAQVRDHPGQMNRMGDCCSVNWSHYRPWGRATGARNAMSGSVTGSHETAPVTGEKATTLADTRRADGTPVSGNAGLMSWFSVRQGWLVWLPVVAAVIGGVALRLVLTRTPLWMDEAQSVANASLPLQDIPRVLRQDGHPPLYYLLLHLWMRVMGEGDAAVRSLSVVFGIATFAPIAALARRLGGAGAVGPALALAATSPFLVRYATETRMYALVVLLALTWWLAVLRAREHPSLGRLAVVAALVASLLFTHYWSLFLLGSGGLMLLASARKAGPEARGTRRVLVALLVGAAAFVIWVPSLLVQLQRTGTPWATAPNPLWAFVSSLAALAGSMERATGLSLYALLIVLLLLGVAGRRINEQRVELELAGAPSARPTVGLVMLAAGAGIAVTSVTDTAFEVRYFSVLLGFVVVLAARGLVQLPTIAARSAVLTAAVVLGLDGSWHAVDDQRSQSAEVAAVINASGQPGLVVACPNHLGPATSRYLDDPGSAVGYPLLSPAARVDFTDWAEHNAAADPDERADRIVEAAGPGPVWLVWYGDHRTIEEDCEQLRLALGQRLGAPADLVTPTEQGDHKYNEPMWLTRFGNQLR